ncbi:MAG: Ig-like domain-containing protein, partial [Gemmatimonadetes bacterium]|nr:Ig-like domain-containing protein [Gemmatimonadota bacterium]
MPSPLLRVRVPAVVRAATRALAIGSALALLAGPASAQQRPVRGDVNGDGRITAADALIVSAHLAGRPVPPTADVAGRGDADGDGRITRADAELILRMVVGKDVSGTALGEPQLPAGTSSLLCRASVRSGTVACEGPQGDLAALHADRISYGGQNKYVRVSTTNVQLDSASEIFSFDLTVQNLLRQAIGTTDGTTVDTSGIRVFFAGDIRATGGVVEVANADGTATFITGNQPFFRYAEILPQNAVSQPRQWRLRRPNGVTEFSFNLLVSSPVQFPHGWVRVYPGVQEISAGGTAALGDSVFHHVGTHLRYSTIALSSSDASVSTVRSNGFVTGVADGVATITATQGPRSGSMQVSVRTASTATSTFTVARDTLPVRDTSRVTLQLRNAAGVPLTRGGGNVVFSTSLGVLDGVTNNHDGTYTALLTSTSVGTARVAATLNGNAVADTATVVFTAGAAASYRVTSSADTVEAGGAVTITAQALDAYGNPVLASGSVVTWSSTGGGSFASPTSTTDAAGAASVAFTADSA